MSDTTTSKKFTSKDEVRKELERLAAERKTKAAENKAVNDEIKAVKEEAKKQGIDLKAKTPTFTRADALAEVVKTMTHPQELGVIDTLADQAYRKVNTGKKVNIGEMKAVRRHVLQAFIRYGIVQEDKDGRVSKTFQGKQKAG